ncbi:MAG: ABC transporter permease [Planctomycetota bacterium]|jgi:ABC-type transport system involved in multi-copper enzyme maturation permease subunit
MRSIWAVARNTLAQAVRMKIAAVVVLLLLILLPLMSMVMDGDGTLLGKLRTFTSYGLGLIGMLLCILTIAVSTFTLSNDIKRKHIFLVITKPIRRWELVVGKLLAIVFLNIVLLGVFSGIVYGCTLKNAGRCGILYRACRC